MKRQLESTTVLWTGVDDDRWLWRDGDDVRWNAEEADGQYVEIGAAVPVGL